MPEGKKRATPHNLQHGSASSGDTAVIGSIDQIQPAHERPHNFRSSHTLTSPKVSKTSDDSHVQEGPGNETCDSKSASERVFLRTMLHRKTGHTDFDNHEALLAQLEGLALHAGEPRSRSPSVSSHSSKGTVRPEPKRSKSPGTVIGLQPGGTDMHSRHARPHSQDPRPGRINDSSPSQRAHSVRTAIMQQEASPGSSRGASPSRPPGKESRGDGSSYHVSAHDALFGISGEVVGPPGSGLSGSTKYPEELEF